MFALNKFLATSQHYLVAPMPSQEAMPPKAAGTAATATAANDFSELPRGLPMEQLTMAALVTLSGLTLANSVLGA